jgi:hypothetical protein
VLYLSSQSHSSAVLLFLSPLIAASGGRLRNSPDESIANLYSMIAPKTAYESERRCVNNN